MKLKLGIYPILINGKKALMYPDSGAAMTVMPGKFMSPPKNKKSCKNEITVLNGRKVFMSKVLTDVKFGKTKRRFMVHVAPGLRGNIVWVGYNELLLLGVDSIDIKNRKKNFKTINSSCNL